MNMEKRIINRKIKNLKMYNELNNFITNLGCVLSLTSGSFVLIENFENVQSNHLFITTCSMYGAGAISNVIVKQRIKSLETKKKND